MPIVKVFRQRTELIATPKIEQPSMTIGATFSVPSMSITELRNPL
jgi:hypothetical protein